MATPLETSNPHKNLATPKRIATPHPAVYPSGASLRADGTDMMNWHCVAGGWQTLREARKAFMNEGGRSMSRSNVTGRQSPQFRLEATHPLFDRYLGGVSKIAAGF